jgi:hypothetical protein
MKLKFSDKKAKLLKLALDPAAQPGEISNSAAALIESLRRRHVDPHKVLNSQDKEPDYGLCIFPYGQHKGKEFRLIHHTYPGYLSYQLNWIQSTPDVRAKFRELAISLERFLRSTANTNT